LVVASPVEDYFLYIDDLPYPEKVRIYDLVSVFILLSNSKFLCHYLIIDDSKKLIKLRDHFLMLLEMTTLFVARVR
jgi:hypothetical protein